MLASLSLAQYAEAFEEAGYDDLEFLRQLAAQADGQDAIDRVTDAVEMAACDARKLAWFLRGYRLL